jgi:hypothetical protein
LAKFYNPTGAYFDICQALIIAHFYDWDPFATVPEWHAIALWNSFYYNPWDLIVLVNWDPDNQLPPETTTDEQLGMAALLIAMPQLISDCCTWCKQTFSHPWKLRLNIYDGWTRQKVIPACCYDPSYPYPKFTPDFWPPVY